VEHILEGFEDGIEVDPDSFLHRWHVRPYLPLYTVKSVYVSGNDSIQLY
jgi:hypothetical protein